MSNNRHKIPAATTTAGVTTWLARVTKAILLEMDNLQDIKRILNRAYHYHERTPTPQQLQMYAEDLMEFPAAQVERAIKVWNTKKPPEGHNPRPPKPCDIIDLLAPKVSMEAEANALAASILKCVSTCGYTQPKRAEETIGPIGWQIVQARAGWKNLCETVTVDNLTTMHAQLRDSAKSVLMMRPMEDVEIRQVTGRETVKMQKPELRRLSSIAEVLEGMPQPNQAEAGG